jgi:glucuronosyltransferase
MHVPVKLLLLCTLCVHVSRAATLSAEADAVVHDEEHNIAANVGTDEHTVAQQSGSGSQKYSASPSSKQEHSTANGRQAQAHTVGNPPCKVAHLDVNASSTILFVAYYQKSPIIALNGLAEELAARGHRVLFATTSDDRHLISSAPGVQWLDAGSPPDTVDAMTLPELFEGEAVYAESVYKAVLPQVSSADSKPDLVVFECLSFAGEALANTLQVPSVLVAPHVQELCFMGSEPDARYPAVISGVASSRMSLLQRIQNSLIIKGEQYIIPLLRGLKQNSARANIGLPTSWTNNQPYGRAQLALHAVIPGLLKPRPTAPLLQAAGALLPRAYRPLSHDLQAWLDTNPDGHRTVFVSIGTNSQWPAETATAMLSALVAAARSKQFRTVWSIKKAQQALLDLDTIKGLEGLIRIEPFAEQLAILEHPSTAAFVTHTGLSSVQESLYYGVPMVAMPMMLDSDQPTNAARVEELGVAVWVDRRKGEPTARDLLESITTVLDMPTYVQTAQRWQAVARRLSGRQRAADLVEAVLPPARIHELLATDEDFSPLYPLWAFSALLATSAILIILTCIRRCRRPSEAVTKKKAQ